MIIIKKLYQDIWNKGKDEKYIVTKTRSPFESEKVSFNELAHFVSMKGSRYENSSKKLLVIGRAVNGWYSKQARNVEEYGEYVEKALSNIGFEWVVNKNGVLYNKEETYCLSTPFWITIKDVLAQILDGDCDEKWIEHIAWTNLYKIAPTYMDNPDEKMKMLQQKECLEILRKEIELYKPTHILAITGWKNWFENFVDIFEDVEINGTNIAKGKNANNVYVEATAKYGNVPVIITCRPEMRNKTEYKRNLMKYFDK